MRGGDLRRLAFLLIGIGAAAGCRSVPSPPSELLDGGLVSSPALTPAQEQAAQAHAWYALGIHYELSADFERAEEAYRRALEHDPGNERLILAIARNLLYLQRTEEAIRAVETFLVGHPNSEGVLTWLANMYLSAGEMERGIQLFRQLTRLAPHKPVSWLQLAAALIRQGDSAGAAAVLAEGATQAQPPTSLLQEHVRLLLGRLERETQPAARQQIRQQAIVLLRRISAELPADMEILQLLADLLLQDGQLEEALRLYDRIQRLRPDDPAVKQRLARAFLQLDEKSKAIEILESLVKESTNASPWQSYLAELYLLEGNYTNAVFYFRAAAEGQPDDPAPWVKLAALQAETNEADAVKTLQQALRRLPEDPKLLEVFALIRLGQNRYVQAAELMRRAYESALSRPGKGAELSPLFFYNYATICTHLRQTAEAAGWLQRGVEQEPALLGLYLQRALTATRTYRRQATDVLRYLAGQPSAESAAIRIHLAHLYLAQGKAALAVQSFESALEIIRKNPLQATWLNARFYFWYGVALDQNRQTDRAIKMFEAALVLDPEYADALNYLAYLWAVRNERLEEALRHSLASLALDPENAAYLDTLGWIYYRLGRLEEALKFLEKADALRPNDPEILDHLRQVREALGR